MKVFLVNAPPAMARLNGLCWGTLLGTDTPLASADSVPLPLGFAILLKLLELSFDWGETRLQ